jgi:hypothetical protein
MQSKLLTVLNIDPDLMRKDVAAIAGFQLSRVYKEFVCGELHSCVLWNRRGDLHDTILESYDGSAKETEQGVQLPYIKQLISSVFHLKPNSVFMPHRDYLELNRDFIRMHVPLKTDSNCYHSEEDVVYHMNLGEVWYLDASRVHSAASFSEHDRLHLILDFSYRDSFQDLLKTPILAGVNIPASNLIIREEFSEKLQCSLSQLKYVIDGNNFYDVFAILIKQYFKTKVSAVRVYDWLSEISSQSGNSDLVKKSEFIKNYCLLNR